jgi:hypothetical protein
MAPLGAWLFRIAHNRALDLLRSGAIRAAEPIEAAHEVADPGSPDPVEVLMRREAQTLVLRLSSSCQAWMQNHHSHQLVARGYELRSSHQMSQRLRRSVLRESHRSSLVLDGDRSNGARADRRPSEFSGARPTLDAAPMCVGTHFGIISWQLLFARVRVANRAISAPSPRRLHSRVPQQWALGRLLRYPRKAVRSDLRYGRRPCRVQS